MRTATKNTPIGVLPADWAVEPLGELFSVAAGGDWDPENCVKVRDSRHPYPVVANALAAGASQGYCTYYKAPGDTLTVTGRGDVGHAVYRPEPFVPIVRLLALVPRRDLSSRFYAEYINAQVHFSLESTGVPQLTAPQVRPCLLAVPPAHEQRAIAAVLQDVDDLITYLERSIVKKQAIKQGMMQWLFRSVQEGTGGHAMRSGRLVAFLGQPATYGIVKAGEFQRNGVAMVRGGDIRDGKISSELPRVTCEKSEEYARTVLRDGDVVVALVGYPGASAVVPRWLVGANISRAVGLLRPATNLVPAFLAHYLNSPLGRREFLKPSAGSAQIVVNLADLNRMKLSVPPIDMQSAIAATLSDADAEIAAFQARLNKAAAVKAGMIQGLLTGRTRLPVKEPAA